MRYFLSKHIHSGFSSFSSDDVLLVREISKKDKPCYKEKEVGRGFGFTIYYVADDETFYKRALRDRKFYGGDYDKTKEFKDLVLRYESEGWLRNIEWLEEVQKKHWAMEDARELRRRIRSGYVIPDWKPDLPVGSYQGGFSDEVFRQGYLQKYLSNGGVHGYIGHSIRKRNIDVYIEMKFMSETRPICILEGLDSEKLLSDWLTSSDGRHFGDSLEGKSFRKQKEYIDSHISSVFNTAYIYSLSEHGGTLGSMVELREKYAGKLLPE
jgi:hypothetical protein